MNNKKIYAIYKIIKVELSQNFPVWLCNSTTVFCCRCCYCRCCCGRLLVVFYKAFLLSLWFYHKHLKIQSHNTFLIDVALPPLFSAYVLHRLITSILIITLYKPNYLLYFLNKHKKNHQNYHSDTVMSTERNDPRFIILRQSADGNF